MADDTENVKFKLDLDSGEFAKSIGTAKSLMGDLAKEAGLPTTNLLKMAETVGFVGAAFLAFKASLSLVETAEEIKAVNAQFEILSRNAGVSTETLREGLIKAAAGLVDDTDLIKAANQALVTMGDSAARLPEILGLARNVTAIFGGELLSNFERLNFAISTGNQRALKHLGIVIDTEKAIREYAKANNVAVDSLSEHGKKQAVLNAALEKQKTAFKGAPLEIQETKNSLERLHATMKELGDVVSIVFYKIWGQGIKDIVQWTGAAASTFKRLIVDKLGEGSDQAAAHIERLREKINDYKVAMIDLEQKNRKFGSDYLSGGEDRSRQIEGYKKNIAAMVAELDKAIAKSDELKSKTEEGTTGGGAPGVDPKKLLEEQRKFNSELNKLREERVSAELQTMQTVSQADDLFKEQQILKQQQFENKKHEIELSPAFSPQEKSALILQIEETKNAQIKGMEDNLVNYKIQALEQELAHTNNVYKQMTVSAELESLKQGQAFKKAGGIGAAAQNSFRDHTINAFKQMGDGSKSAADAIKGAFLGALGDMAIKQGTFMMLDAFKTFPFVNVPELAAGGGLIALGSALGSSGGGAQPSEGGGGGGAAPSLGQTGYGATADQQKQSKTVSLTIQGSLYETEETKLRLVEMVRQASDATDFRINQIGT